MTELTKLGPDLLLTPTKKSAANGDATDLAPLDPDLLLKSTEKPFGNGEEPTLPDVDQSTGANRLGGRKLGSGKIRTALAATSLTNPSERPSPTPTPSTTAAVGIDKIGTLWRERSKIVAAVALSVVVVGAVTFVMPSVYSATSQVSIVAAQSGTASRESVRAVSELASQYAQLVTTAPVIAPAAEAEHIPASDLASRTSSGTVENQNLIRIEVQSGSPGEAKLEAAALATSLTTFVNNQIAEQSKAFQTRVVEQLAPLDDEIATASENLAAAQAAAVGAPMGSSAIAQLSAAAARVNTLIDRRAGASINSLMQAAAVPEAQVVAGAEEPSKIQPRPVLYCLIAALVALVLASQCVLVFARRKLAAGAAATGV